MGLFFLLVGNVVVVGAKENLLILAVPNLLLALIEMRAGRTGGVRWWVCMASVASAAIVAAPVIAYLAGSAVDTYGRSVAFQDRLAVLAGGTIRPTAVHGAFIMALGLWLGMRMVALGGRVTPSAAWQRLTSCLLLVSGSALVLLLSQIVLYNGDITPHTRYEFPAALAGPAVLAAAFVCVRSFLHRTGALRAERAAYPVTAAVFLALALLNIDGFREQREWSRQWAAATRGFTARITAAASAAREAPDVPIVVMSGRPLDLEPIVSIGRFLRKLGVSNPRFLVLDWQSGRSQWSPLEAHLAPGLERVARESWLGYEPEERLNPEAPCFSIGLTREPRRACRSLGRLW